MAQHMNQERWEELVTSFLRVKDTCLMTGDEEAALAATLSNLSYCTSKLRIMYDHRQIHCVVDQCVSGIVSPKSSLVKQTSHLLASLLRWQSSTSLSSLTLDKVIAWLSSALKYHGRDLHDNETVHQILRALAAALRDAVDHSDEIYLSLAGTKGSLTLTLDSNSPWQNQALAMRCLHLLTYVAPEIVAESRQHNEEIFPAEVVSTIQRIVIGILRQPLPNPDLCSHKLYLHLVASALSVLYNLVVCAPNDILGNIIVSTCRPFVFYGLPGFAHSELVQHTASPEVEVPLSSGMESDSSSRNYTNRNRRKRLRRKRAQPSRSTSDCDSGPCPLVAAVDGMGLGLRVPPPAATLAATVSLKPQWAREKQTLKAEKDKISVNSSLAPETETSPETTSQDESTAEVRVSGSETDFSDFEGGGEKESTLMARARQCSLQAINAVIDKVGKQHKFSYWPPLMCQAPSLMTSVLKDPSASVRMASLQVINTFLLDSSQVLTHAVENEGKSYTTLGQQLGASLRELHRCLALALLSEKFPGALVRTLKTIELLVENVNYSKLKPGLLTKVVTHVKYFMKYKEAVVRANAFSVMVSVLMIKPQVAELRDLLMRYQIPAPPILTLPPQVMPPQFMEEELPEEEDEAEAQLKEQMERMNMLSEDEEEKTENNMHGKSVVSWLMQRCVDSLLTPDHDAVRGIYIQVQLQSLKVLSALVSEHLSIIQHNLPLIQHVISVCSEAVRELPHPRVSQIMSDSHKKFEVGEGFDPALMSPDPGVVVEHAYTLLGSLLGAVKADLDKGNEACTSVSQVQQLWFWALQGPLQILFKQSTGEQSGISVENMSSAGEPLQHNAANWRTQESVGALEHEEHLKQMVAVATVLTHLSPSIFESLGEEWITCIITTVRWLVTYSHPDLRLAGIRIMAIIVGFSGVVGNPGAVSLLQATVVTTCDLLAQRENNVNRDRLLASWALANISSVFEFYVDNWSHQYSSNSEILPPTLTARLLEVGIRACKDKDKIKPHGVRCVGNVTSFLHAQQVADSTLAPLVSKAIDTLVLCSSTGSNMKTRWNACHALGNILSSGQLPIASMPWKSQVLSTLGSLVESFKNYKVRIQACSAICGLRSREEFGSDYYGIWRVLLHGLDNAQNIIDYQEIRHRDELINQICQGICQLSTHITLEDAGSLCELLQLHHDMAMPLLIKAYHSLPPERTVHALKAHSRVEELLSYDALTESQQQALTILHSLTASPTST
ncbi:HEAT repeat-containing protein 6 isoform X1 [Cherax quadricarinatus]|nr:HEAT repeat-containing protein 6-like isoform X1 [Cherax quadricarinatus]XP_053631164.1 HEAT repeat-containing protein 6-like isoform X1 [Cherax quadricarinatus]